jgi:ABC-type multidrug transport system ATPase subunit
MTYAIEAAGLVKRFGKTLAVDQVDLAVLPGKVLGLLGPNGAGKTTVVRMLATLLRPDAGYARVCGADVVRQADRVRELIGLTGQYAAVDEDLTGFVRSLVADGTTVLLTTQYLDEADRLANEIAVVDHGKVIATGTAAELKAKVGGQTLDVRPADPADLAQVAAIITATVGSAPASSAEDPGLLSVPVEDPQVMPAVVARLQASEIEVTELALRLASLDEVFMALTGHAAEEGSR